MSFWDRLQLWQWPRDVWDWELGLASGFWSWLHETSPGQATFLGSLFGFLALLGGALFNAWLNRRRDDRLRQQDRRAIATALKAELAELRGILLSNTEDLQKKQLETGDMILVQDFAQSVRIMPEMIDKAGLLDPETIQSVISAHMGIEEYCERMLAVGGRLAEHLTHRRLVRLPADKAKHVIVANTKLSGFIQEAIAKLDAEIAKVDASLGSHSRPR